MNSDIKELTDFFKKLDADQVSHTDKTYLAHALGVQRELKSWGCDEELCRVGIFHSIYGTEKFQKFALPLDHRDEVRALIGERAERLAYVNCVMVRSSFDAKLERADGPYRVTDRVTEEEIELSPEDFDDLCRVHLCDWLEQVPRSREWNYRRAAYTRMAARLGGVAEESHKRIFDAEGAEKTT